MLLQRTGQPVDRMDGPLRAFVGPPGGDRSPACGDRARRAYRMG